MEEKDYYFSLRNEITNAQNHRFKQGFQKIIFIVGLLSLGSIDGEIGQFSKFYYLIYFVPFVAFIFDLYIIGENFGIRRIGNFIKFTSKSKDEKFWEFLLNIPEDKNRDIFASSATKSSTLIACALSLLVLIVVKYIINTENNYWLDIVWLVIVILAYFIIWVVCIRQMNNNLIRFNQTLIRYKNDWKDKINEEEKIYIMNYDVKIINQKIIEKYHSG